MANKAKQFQNRARLGRWGCALWLLASGCTGLQQSAKSDGALAPKAGALAAQQATLEAQLRTQGDKADANTQRELGWVYLLSGNLTAAEPLLQKAAAASDIRAQLGLGLLHQERGQFRRASEEWLTLLERYVETVSAQASSSDAASQQDPWAAATAEMAAHRLLLLGGDGTSAEADRKLRERLLALWQKYAARQSQPGQTALLPKEAAQLTAALLGQLLRLHGDEPTAAKVDAERGCPSWLYVTGPGGYLPSLDLLSKLPADDAGRDPERARYRRTDASGCNISLESPSGRPGVLHVTAWVEVAKAGPLPLTIESGGVPFALYVDGQRSYHDPQPLRRRPLTAYLSAGWHALTVKVGIGSGRGQLQLAMPEVRFFDGPASAAPAVPAATAPATVQVRSLTEPPAATSPASALMARLLLGQQAYLLSDAEAGLQALEPATQAAPKASVLAVLQAGLLMEDRSRPDRLLRDQARSLLEQVLKDQPELVRARQILATMLLQDEHSEQALELLDQSPKPPEPSWQIALLRYRVLKARGFAPEAEQALKEARQLGPTACQTLEQLVDFRREQQDVRGAMAAAAELRTCNPYSDRYAEELVDAAQLPEAAREYQRLLKLEPESIEWQFALAKVLLARRSSKDAALAESLLLALTERVPKNPSYAIELSGAYLDNTSQNDQQARQRARQVLLTSLRQVPESAELHKALLALGQHDEMDAYRVDGKQIIGDFVRNTRGTFDGEPAVLVLDRTVVRVLPTGAQLTLTHNIIRVLTKDGLAKFGEVHIPEGAEVLTLRTIKADGQTREPEEIPDKDSVSAPDLEVGDYVEFEYLDRDGPQAAFPGGFLAERFYFGSADAPLDRSEYLLIVPESMAVQLDARGPRLPQSGPAQVPTPQVEVKGGERHSLWVRRQVPRLYAEAPLTEGLLDDWMPSIRAGAGLSFPRYVNYLRERRYRTLKLTQKLRELAQEQAGAAKLDADGNETAASLLSRTSKLDTWVRKNIRQGGSIDEAASSILARREGRRDVLLLALLRAAEIPAEAWLVRSQMAPPLEGPLPDVLAYNEVLVAVAPGKGPQGGPLLWLDPVYRHVPTGYVRPMLRGGKALRLTEAPGEPPTPATPEAPMQQVTLPLEGGAPIGSSEALPQQAVLTDSRKLEMTMQLDKSGDGEVTVRETLTGWPALEWREQVENLAEDKLRQQIEQRALGFYFPGASLIDLKHGPLTDDLAPLVVEYRFRAPQLLRQRGGQPGQAAELVLPAPYPLMLSRNYVSVAKRQLPLQLNYALPTTLDAKVMLPPGAQVLQTLPDVELTAFGRFVQKVRSEPGVLRLHTETALPLQRVMPDRYPLFVEFAARLDAAEESIAVLSVP